MDTYHIPLSRYISIPGNNTSSLVTIYKKSQKNLKFI